MVLFIEASNEPVQNILLVLDLHMKLNVANDESQRGDAGEDLELVVRALGLQIILIDRRVVQKNGGLHFSWLRYTFYLSNKIYLKR